MEVVLNEKQLAVLQWIADGSPAGVYGDDAHKLSARVLHRRGLARISGRGPSWRAQITEAGRTYLDDTPELAPRGPKAMPPTVVVSAATESALGARAPIKTEQLVADVLAAGGRLELPDQTSRGGVNWRQRAYAAQRHGKVPDGKHLEVSWNRDGFVIELKDGVTGNELGAEPIHVPARLTKYHPVAKQFRDRTALQEISRKALPRALRIIHALVTELERRGHQAQCVDPPHPNTYGRSDYKPKTEGQLVVTINGHELKLRVYEKGVGLRGIWERQKQHYEDNRLNFSLGYLPSRPTAYDKEATGHLNMEIVSGYTPRQTSWGDRQRWTLEDRLPQVLRELETLAAEAEAARLEREREQAEQERGWEAAMDEAKRRFIADQHLEVLSRRVRAWQEADAIRAYCDAVEAKHSDAIANDPEAAEWLAYARERADQVQRLPRGPADPEVKPEDLKPYLGRVSPYHVRGW